MKKDVTDLSVNKGSALNEALVEVKDLKKEYKVGKQKVVALKNVSLSIYKGEFLALTGPSGSGKSTLLQLIGGLDKPSAGEVTIEGTSLSKMNDSTISEFRNRTIGFVFQFFYLQPFLTLEQNIELATMPTGWSGKSRKERVLSLAKEVGLEPHLKHLPKELSGGQIQRAAIARALMNNPSLLLADEPTGNLDSANSKRMLDIFENIRQRYGTTIVVVTHDQDIARQADRTINLKDGELV